MRDEARAAPSVRGDRTALTYDERMLLETKILPTARRWLDMPGLDVHGMQTLTYWGERFEIPIRLRSREEREKAGW